jgi:hypothetical protein
MEQYRLLRKSSEEEEKKIGGKKLVYEVKIISEIKISFKWLYNILLLIFKDEKSRKIISSMFIKEICQSTDKIVIWNPLKTEVDRKVRSRYFGRKESPYTNLFYIINKKFALEDIIILEMQIKDTKLISLFINEEKEFKINNYQN